jgi:hypothetical protein
LNRQEFVYDLPRLTACDKCGAVLTGVEWSVGQYGPSEWFGIGIAKCEACNWVRVAAAGSDEASHAYARAMRARFVASLKT